MATPIMNIDDPVPAPLVLHREAVRRDWIDYNQHMNMAFYLLAFDHATDELLAHIDLGYDHMKRGGGSTFTLEAHVAYSREVKLGDPLRIASHVLDFDEKRIHYAHEMFHDTEGYLAATNELVTLHVSLETRRAAPMPDATLARLARLKAAHAALPRPDGLSREMGLRHRKKP